MRLILSTLFAAALAFGGTLFLTGCAGRPFTPVHIDYSFSDLQDEQRVEVTYTNNNGFSVCLSVEDWPNHAGKLGFASDVVFLVVDGKKFPVEEFNTGYCTPRSACIITVKPGNQISGSISYHDFDLTEQSWDQPKSLIFKPLGYKC